MRKSVPVQNEAFITQRNPTLDFRKIFEAWLEALRVKASSRKHDAIIEQLSQHLQHDIGESDYRPNPQNLGSLQRKEKAQLMAIRTSLI